MRRTNLNLFLGVLLTLLGFSVVTGAASIVWGAPPKPEPKEEENDDDAPRPRRSPRVRINSGRRTAPVASAPSAETTHGTAEHDIVATDDRPGFKNGTLSGRITDGRTKKAIPRAQIEVEPGNIYDPDKRVWKSFPETPLATIADEEGRYSVLLPGAPDRIGLRIYAPGYQDGYTSAGFDGSATADITLLRDTWIWVKVTDGANVPARFDLRARKVGFLGLSSSSFRRDFTAADLVNGRAQLPLANGRWEVYAESGKRRTKRTSVEVGADNMDLDLTLEDADAEK